MKKAQTKPLTAQRTDGTYLLKLVLYLLVGSIWLKLQFGSGVQIGLPIGLALGMFIAARDRTKADRKIEYAVLIVAGLIGYLAPYGLYLSI